MGCASQGIGAPGPAMLRPGGTDAPHFCMGQDCLWEQRGATQRMD